MPPLISVVMPVYNGERFLREAIDSILCQTYTDFEFIIIDDGSTDATTQILAEYQQLDRRIVVHGRNENQGIVAALNLGCSLARGRFIARMDADDISLPHRFEVQIRTFEQNPLFALVGSSAIFIDENGATLGTMAVPREPGLINWNLIFGNCIIHSSIMMRTEVAIKNGPYKKGFNHAEDYEFWSRLCRSEILANVPEPLLQYREWGESISRKQDMEQEMIAFEISRSLLTFYLKADLAEPVESVIHYLNNPFKYPPPDNFKQFNEAAKILNELYSCFSRKVALSRLEQQLMSVEMSLMFYRLSSLALPYSVIDAVTIALHGLRYHPESIIRMCRKFLRRVYRHVAG